MNRDGLFAGLPAEFSPPEKAADHIAHLRTLAEREAYWLRIPQGWRAMIAQLAKMAIALRIIELSAKAQRQDALASVPEIWRADVKALVLTFWRTREIRAEYQAELAARRGQSKETA